MKYHKLVFLILIIIFFIGADSNADTESYGLWETKSGIKPRIKISIKRKKRTFVELNGKKIEMKYNFIVSKSNNSLLEFRKDVVDSDGSENYTIMYFILGAIKGKPVLQGFYTYSEYNKEGRGEKEVSIPITLYRKKVYEWND